MDILLISPLKKLNTGFSVINDSENSLWKERANNWEERFYENRASYQTKELLQKKKNIYTYKEGVSFQPEGDLFEEYQLIFCDLYNAQNQFFLVSYIRLLNNSSIIGKSSLELEDETNKITQYICESMGKLEVKWVNRTIITNSPQEEDLLPPGWLAEDFKKVDWAPTARSGGPAPEVVSHISWGNNKVFSEVDFIKEIDPTEFIRGMIDTQGIWGQSDVLLLKTQNMSHEIIDRKFDREKDYSKYNGFLIDIKERKAFLDLSVDELNLDVQGIRRKVALACYEAWGLETLQERLIGRIQSIDGINSYYHDKFRSENRAWVNKLLLTLSLLTIFQFLLGLVDISFVGDIKNIQSGDGIGHLGVTDFIRSISTDIWMLIFTIVTLLIALVAFQKNRNAE